MQTTPNEYIKGYSHYFLTENEYKRLQSLEKYDKKDNIIRGISLMGIDGDILPGKPIGIKKALYGAEKKAQEIAYKIKMGNT